LQDAFRGQAVLYVSDTSQFQPGMWVRLMQSNPASGGLVTNLMSGLITEGPESPVSGRM